MKKKKVIVKKVKKTGWKVKHPKRPEELHSKPEEFYSAPEAGRFSNSNSMKRIQRELTMKAASMILFPLTARILDAGCGAGFTLQTLKQLGYKQLVGVDASESMAREAQKKGFAVTHGDMRHLPFPKESFEGLISISALQWIPEKEMNLVAKSFYKILKPFGKAVIQFYPKSEEELMSIGKTFKQAGFHVILRIENEDNAKKRRVFLLLEKQPTRMIRG